MILKGIKKGQITIKVNKACYALEEKTVEVTGGRQISVLFNLKKTCGRLTIKSDPAGADWYLDGKHMGITPQAKDELHQGAYQITMKKKDYDEWNRTIQVVSDKTIVLHPKLKIKIVRDGSYGKHPNGIVYDENTGLEWYPGPDKNTNWNEAKIWVESLSVAGGKWRMPSRGELKNLYKMGAGKRNMTPLLKTTGWWIWSDEIRGTRYAGGFDFRYGGTAPWILQGDSNNARGFAVRSSKERD